MERKLDHRDGFIYDPIIKGFDTLFWATLAGTPAMSSNVLRLTSASIASYTEYFLADIQFRLNIAVAPTAGQNKVFGLYSPVTTALGSAYFKINGAVFTAESTDDVGNTKSTTLTWSSYEGVETVFRIRWEEDAIKFYIGGAVVATHSVVVPSYGSSLALPIRVTNANADNMDIAYIAVRQTGSIV
jgi:hypothetical protein